ncbi:MAG TPA: glycoside hydrolase family 65 protein, partial [Candidatus Limnocylindria bacterium]|nr:glycoside hydrolase family 65 protein [Candidatus Limnocylindria bacterium]
MRQKLTPDPWTIVQDSFSREDQRFFESLTSLGNGAMGMRGSFEEDYSGDTLRGTYIGGVWFPDRTRVGWWKNGYPEYFGKQINAMDLIGLSVSVNGETLDAGAMEVVDFRRELDMREGVLRRGMTLVTASGEVTIRAERFVSMDDTPLLCLRYRVTPSFPARVAVTAYLDGEVRNEDSNYDERFWEGLESDARGDEACAHLVSRTKENPFGTPRFTVAGAFRAGGNMAATGSGARTGYAFVTLEKEVAAGETALVDKLVCVATDRDHPAESLSDIARAGAARARDAGYEALLENHVRAWARKWEHADVRIEGDDAAQQGIRFSLFHLLCTYTGDDPRLNIGPKGFTGEKYGGATYWDTEAFCFPVYMAISGEDTARQLLLYRHRQLPGAYENARRLGLPGALYPMVTFDGTECHNEWEITFMELHRNGAIAHAIFNYVTYSGDEAYLVNKGLDVLCGIARFWAGRVHFHAGLGRYMLHGVTGPNEYENNVNNNWYTNRIAAWCLDWFREACEKAPPGRLADLGVTAEELARMGDVSGRMYYPEDTERGVFVQ